MRAKREMMRGEGGTRQDGRRWCEEKGEYCKMKCENGKMSGYR